jgi:C4-dicarboxylate-specific signal transduction histidine kinase
MSRMGRREWVILGVAAAVVVVVVVVLVVACGGSSSSSTTTTTAQSMEQWADSLCTSANTYVSSLKSLGTQVQSGGLSKDSINSAVDDAKSATQTFGDEVKALGAPPVTNSQAKQVLENLSSELSKDAETIQGALSDVSDLSGLLAAAPTITSTITSAGTQVSSAYDEIKQLDPKGDIQQAFTSAPACKSLTGS